jgi:hypothetical protein
MSDWRGFIFLAIGLGVPLVLLLLREERALLAWACLSVGVNVFDARVGLNFAAARLIGLMVLPFVAFGAFHVRELSRTAPARFLAAQVAYLAVLGLIFGYLYPWSDYGFIREWSQTAPGRTLVHMVRTAGDLGLLLFVSRQIIAGVLPEQIVRLLLIGTTIAAVGGVAEFVSGIQIYQVMTGYPIQEVANRVRGFNFEPRGLGLTMAHGLFLAVLWYTLRRSTTLLWVAALHFVVLVLTVSASASIAVVAMGLSLIVLEPRVRIPAAWLGATSAAVIVLLVVWGQDLALSQSWAFNLRQRFSLEAAADLSAENWFDLLTLFLDIFDLTALAALREYPAAALIGAGPGLIMLPAGQFIPDAPRWSYVGATGEGITSLPSMGILLEWSNGGVIGVLLWIGFVAAALRAFGVLMREGAGAEQWRLARGVFVSGAAAYLVQVSPLSAYWPILMGLAVGAGYLAVSRANSASLHR